MKWWQDPKHPLWALARDVVTVVGVLVAIQGATTLSGLEGGHHELEATGTGLAVLGLHLLKRLRG